MQPLLAILVLAERHRVEGCRDGIDRMTTALANLAAAAAGTRR